MNLGNLEYMASLRAKGVGHSPTFHLLLLQAFSRLPLHVSWREQDIDNLCILQNTKVAI